MGAYLSRPKTEKETTSGANSYLSYGASSMQGWRRFQEDAHNCLLDFDPKRAAAYFAVYDGHGGAEVAKYCAAHLPDFLLEQSVYTEEPVNPTALLKNAFVDFDCTLVSPEVKSKLWSIMNSEGEGAEPAEQPEGPGEEDGDDDDDDGEVPEGLEEVAALHDEANKPIEYVLKQYGEVGNVSNFLKSLLSSFKSKGDKTEAAGSSSSAEQADGAPSPNAADAETAKEEKATAKVGATEEDNAATRKISTASSLCEFSARPMLVDQDEIEVIVSPGPSSSKAASKSKAAGAAKAPAAGASAKDAAENEEDDDDNDRDYQVGDEEEDDEDDDAAAADEEAEGGADDDDDDEEEDEEEESGEDEYDDEEEEEEEDDYTPSHFFAPKPVAYNEPGVDSGTTACVAFLLPELATDSEQRRVYLYVANAGDSRAVLCRARAAVDLSTDHKPEDAEEKARIVAAGGTVTADGRVNDGLNLSRALGDHTYKCRKDLKMADQMISALPDVTRTELIPGSDEFLVIACDGIWNSMSSQEVVDFVYDRLHPKAEEEKEAAAHVKEAKDSDKKVGESASDTAAAAVDGEKQQQEQSDKPKETDRSSPTFLSTICEALFDRCLAPNTMGDGTGCDNMTCIIIRFDDLASLATCAVTRTTTKEPAATLTVKSPNVSGIQRKRSECAAAGAATEPAVAGGNSAAAAAAEADSSNGHIVATAAKLNGGGDEIQTSAAAASVQPPMQKKPRTEAETTTGTTTTTSPISRSPIAQPVNGSA